MGSNRSVTLTGTVVTQPQLRITNETQIPVTSFIVSFQERVRGQLQISQVEVVAWRDMAQSITTFVVPGQCIQVHGELHVTNPDQGDKVAKVTLRELPRVLYAQPEVLAEGQSSFNVVNISGNLGQVPKIKFFDSGSRVCTISVAARRGKDQEPTWFTAKFWNETADSIANYCTKGSIVNLEGRLSIETWEAEGVQHSKPVIRGSSITFLGGRPQEDTQAVAPVAQPVTSQHVPPVPAGAVSGGNVPF